MNIAAVTSAPVKQNVTNHFFVQQQQYNCHPPLCLQAQPSVIAFRKFSLSRLQRLYLQLLRNCDALLRFFFGGEGGHNRK